MKVLDLTNLEKSEIKYLISKFPDGQQQIKILDKPLSEEEWFADDSIDPLNSFSTSTGVKIKARLNNFKDLELIICATKSLRSLEINEIHLYTPYFLGSRSDRKFEEGSNNYLKDVICPIINSLKFNSVTVLDPHSDVLEACLDNFKKVDNFQLVKWATNTYQFDNKKKSGKMDEDFIIISPDAGANKKIFKIADQIGYKGEIITCSKSRDEHGNLSRTEVPIKAPHFGKDIIIIDDICDGGATFLNIAKEFHKKYEEAYDWKGIKPKIYLIVTHGIFSKGFKELSQYFDGIYCTNSYRDVADVENSEKTNVKQLNIF